MTPFDTLTLSRLQLIQNLSHNINFKTNKQLSSTTLEKNLTTNLFAL